MTARARAALVGLIAAGAVQVALARASSGPGGILERRYDLLVLTGAWTLAFMAAALCVRALPRRTAVVVVLLLAALVRLASFSEKAPLSDDLYRYAWDGLVQSSGINPYRYPPQADELRDLRTAPGAEWLWPAELAGEERQTLLNRPNVETIYPPVAEAWFWLVHQVVPLEAQDEGYMAVGLVTDLAVLAVLLALLRARGRDPRWVVLYALAPLPVLEAVQNAHVDALAVLLVLVGVLLHDRGRLVAAGVLVTLSALVKVYPGLLFVLLLRERGARTRTVVAAGVVTVATYLPHVLTVGPKVAGYLPGYLMEEQYSQGERYLLVGLTGLSGTPATVVVAVLLAAVLVAVLRSGLPLVEASVLLLCGVFLLVTPVQPWYSLVLFALAAVARWWWALGVGLAAYPLFFATILDGPADLVGRVSYGLAALVVAVALARGATRQPAVAPSVVRAG